MGKIFKQLSKTLENQIYKHQKVQLDISFIKQCKKENIVPMLQRLTFLQDMVLIS